MFSGHSVANLHHSQNHSELTFGAIPIIITLSVITGRKIQQYRILRQLTMSHTLKSRFGHWKNSHPIRRKPTGSCKLRRTKPKKTWLIPSFINHTRVLRHRKWPRRVSSRICVNSWRPPRQYELPGWERKTPAGDQSIADEERNVRVEYSKWWVVSMTNWQLGLHKTRESGILQMISCDNSHNKEKPTGSYCKVVQMQLHSFVDHHLAFFQQE